MRIEDFSPPIQRLIRFINRLESRLERRARARGAAPFAGIGSVPFGQPEAGAHGRSDWGMGRASTDPVVQRSDPGWNDQFGA